MPAHNVLIRSDVPLTSLSLRGRIAALVPFVGSILLLTWAAGCSAPEAASASGTVSFEGEPIADGALRFDPIGGTEGPSGSTKITDGKYTIPAEKGLVPGKYRVAITAVRNTGRTVTAPEALEGESEQIPEQEQYIPEKYNVASELEVTLKPGENQHSFDLK